MTPKALFHPARLARRPVLSTQTDERLVDLVRAGSDPAFETIVERYRRALMRYASRLLPPERAEDVVQQSFVKAYEAILRDEAEIALRPWLYRITHNTALNALRDRGLRHAELDESFDGVERPDQALERAQGLREVVTAVQALPERQRDAILLRELEGRSYEEIAAALGVTDGAVRQLLNRARHTLRAAAAALTPAPLLTRVAGAESAEPVAARVGELVGIGAGGALVSKAAATVLVTGAVVGGAAVAPRMGGEDARAPGEAQAAEDRNGSSGAGAAGPGAGPGADEAERLDDDGGDGSGSGDRRPQAGSGGDARSGGGEDGSGRARDGDESDDDRSGPGRGEAVEDEGGHDRGGGEDEDRSGSGGGDDSDDHHDDGSSGPGGGEPETTLAEDNSGPGSGSGGGGSGSSGSGSDDPPEPEDLLEPDNSGSGSGP